VKLGIRNISKRKAEGKTVEQPVEQPIEQPIDDYVNSGFLTAINSQTALKLSTVYRCVEILSNSVAQLPVLPYYVNNGEKRIMREHPTYKLLAYNPNRRMTKFTYFKQLVCDMLLRGNAYVYIERDKNNNPVQLIYIPADYVAINYNPGNLFDDVTYIVAGFDRLVEHTDMIHLINYSNDGVLGISTIHYAAQSLQVSNESEITAKDNLTNKLSGLLSVESALTDTQKKSAKVAWESSVKQGGIAVLAGGWRYQPVTINARDFQLIESREFNSVDVARWFGVPTTKLGINKGVSYNGIEAEQLAFLSDTLHPLLQKIECELERKLYSDTERQFVDVKFDVSVILRVDLKSKAEYYRTLFNIGVMNINEIRNDLDLPPVEGGDKTYMQVNMTTLDNITNPQQGNV
jgi:HK97 family phage portal protein